MRRLARVRWSGLAAGLLWLPLLLLAGCGPDMIDEGIDDDPVAGENDGLEPADASDVDGDQLAAYRSARARASRWALVKRWAPVWYQDTDSSNHVADYITAVNFDGDYRSDNNWENLHDGARLGAVIYYSIVETSTHYFILYTDFHARDWAKHCSGWIPLKPDSCHENDMEGVMVVVRKSPAYYGTFEALYTEAHNALHLYVNDGRIRRGSSKNFRPDVPVTFEDGHPEVYVESKGHGVCALYHSGSHCEHPTKRGRDPFPGGDGVVYRYKGRAETPSSGNDRDVGYALHSLRTRLWSRRENICDGGCTFDKLMLYGSIRLGKAFDGDSHKDDAASPPWAWDDPEDGPVYRGDFFFRPAKALATHLDLPRSVSQTYLYNPYLPRGR